MPQPKLFALLLQKASQDEYVLDKLLADAGAPLEIFGFHAQQAAEKYLKALFAAEGKTYPMTHRLAELIDLAKEQGIQIPEHFDEVRVLTPFAVEFRYDVFPLESEEPLDKTAVRKLLKEIRTWVESRA
jgi:HEPN domain-containing protein